MHSSLKFNREFIRQFWTLFRPFWQSDERYIAFGLFILSVFGTVGSVIAIVGLNQFQKEFYDALASFNQPALLQSLTHFLGWLVFIILCYGYGNYFQTRLSLKWRKWLTHDYLRQYFHNQAYYHLQQQGSVVDNPDQRLSDDLSAFTSLSLNIFFALLSAVMTLGSFLTILWNLSGNFQFHVFNDQYSIPGYLCWCALIYAVIGTYLMNRLGIQLPILNYHQQKLSAHFRYGLVRLRENSEQIAFFSGESFENKKLKAIFESVYDNGIKIALLHRRLSFFRNAYNNVSSVVGILFTMPMYLSKKIVLGTLMQISSAFGEVLNGFSVFINSFDLIREWQAVVVRIAELHEKMIDAHLNSEQMLRLKPQQGGGLELKNFNLCNSHGEILLKDLHLVLKPGDGLLIQGPSGIGKTTLFRALAGLWPHAYGDYWSEPSHEVLFLSQRSYLPIGTLKEAIIYPSHAELSDEQAALALEQVGLSRLTSYLHDTQAWSHTLSLGEQQLLTFTRIYLMTPKIVYLDEATSAMDEQLEHEIYQKLREWNPNLIIISIGHRGSLKRHHSRTLILGDQEQVALEVPCHEL